MFKFRGMPAALVCVLQLTMSSVSAQPPTPMPRQVGSFEIDSITNAPEQLVMQAHLRTTPSRVFGLLERYEDMPKWLPMLHEVKCDRSASGGTSGIGAIRTCALKDGSMIHETIVGFEKDRLIAYRATENPMGLTNHLAVITTDPSPDGGTNLTWRQYFEHPDAPMMAGMMAGMMDVAFQKLVKGYGGGQFGTVKGFENVEIDRQFVVNATPDDVWSVLGRDFGGVAKWSSMIPHAEVIQLPNGGTQRKCSTPAGDFAENVTQYDESARILSYQVVEGMPPAVARAKNTWQVSPTGDGRSSVTMRMRLEMQPNVPKPMVEMMRSNFSGMAEMATSDLAYYMENGKKQTHSMPDH